VKKSNLYYNLTYITYIILIIIRLKFNNPLCLIIKEKIKSIESLIAPLEYVS